MLPLASGPSFVLRGGAKVFSSDSAPECRRVLKCQKDPGKIYEDVLTRPPADEEYVDLYTWTPPCQSFSAGGKMQGIKVKNGQLLASGLKYMKANRPRVAILENIKGFGMQSCSIAPDALGATSTNRSTPKRLAVSIAKAYHCVA